MRMPQIGDVIGGKHRIEQVLGEGGYGRVYRGVTELSNRAVAIKVLKPGREGYDLKRTQRFLRELRAIAKLQSPYTLTLFDYGKTDEGVLFMVTEFIEGQDLVDVLAERGTLSERETAHVMMQLLQSLGEAHDVGVLHRDIKPSNVRLFSYQGDSLRAKLLDFGLAQSLRTEETRLTGTGMVVGTPRYMSPEQIHGRELTPGSDIYSLGLVAVECVVGRTAERPTPELSPDANVSPQFRNIVNRMLAADPAVRFRSAGEVYDALRGVRTPGPRKQAQEPPKQDPVAVAPVSTQQERPARPMMVGMVVGIAALLCVGAWFMLRSEPAPPPAPPARSVNAGALLRGSTEVGEAEKPAAKATLEPARKPEPAREAKSGCGVTPAISGEAVLNTPGEYLQVNIYVPTWYQADQRHPVIVAFHDFPGGPWGVIRRSGLDRLAEEHGIIVVAIADSPDGFQGIWDSDEDAKRAERSVRAVTQSFCIDESRIFAFGHGSGGRGVERMVCGTDVLAAAATTSYRPGATGEIRCNRHVPRLNIDPQNNQSAPPKGGKGCGVFSHPVLSSEAYDTELRGRAACAGKPKIWLKHEAGTCRTWECETALVTCRVEGGREFPGTRPRSGIGITEGCDGQPGDFPYLETVWRFFEEVAPANSTKPAEPAD